MSWTTVLWSMVVGICLTMAVPHLIIGLRQRDKRVSLFFALAGFAIAGLAVAEFGILRATTVEQSARVLRFAQVPIFVMLSAMVGFVWTYFGTARLWLGVLAAGLRGAGLIPNFFTQPNLNFREMTGIRTYPFLGETLSSPLGTPSSWLVLAYLSSILFLIFVADASIALWRRGQPDDRRRAVLIGGGILFFVVVSQTCSALINAGLIAIPYLVSIPFLAIVAAMGFELTYDVIRAAQLSEKLQVSEERMALAAERGRLALWEWAVDRDEVWMTPEGRDMLGLARETHLHFSSLTDHVHPEDRPLRIHALRHARETGGIYDMEYRRLRPDGTLQWIAARGRSVRNEKGAVARILGVSMDITRQKQADAEVQRQRDELAHLARVAVVGEMATSLAHELNQPLTAIVTNAAAAERFLARGPMKAEDLQAVLADIRADGRRAGEIIRGIKGMVRKVPAAHVAVDLNAVVADVLRLVRADALGHDCIVATELDPALPVVNGDAVQLQQVLLNLVINAFDAMRASPAETRRIEISSRRVGAAAEVVVRDFGPGLPPEVATRVFDRFFSTKPEGMGLGLAIARSITEAHGGTLDGDNAPQGGGARFWFRVPVRAAAAENNHP